MELLHIIWPGSLFTSAFPSTFLIYLFAYVLLFSRALQWKPWKGNEWRWSGFVGFLALTTVLNGPVLYEFDVHIPQGGIYTPLFLELFLLLCGLYAVTSSSVLTVLVTVAIGYAAEHVAAGVVQILTTLLFHSSGEYPHLGYAYKAMAFGTYMLVGLVMWMVAGRKTFVSDDAIRDRKGWIIGSILVLCFTIFADSVTMGVMIFFTPTWIPSARIFSLVLFGYELLCTAMVLVVLLTSSSRDRLASEVSIMHQMMYKQKQHYEIAQEYRDILNMKMHDLKKMSSGVWEHSEKMQNVLRETLQTYDALYDTGHHAVDAVLNEKSLLCMKRGISLHAMVEGEALSFMNDVDVYSLLGNILDNAVAAALGEITLNIQTDGQMVLIRESNSYEGHIQMYDGLPLSSRSGADHAYQHGFGMRSIRYIVQEYGGHMQVQTEGQLFILTIILPKPLTD